MLSGPTLKFCEGIISGLSGEAAWMESHPGCKPASARSNAARALAKANIQAEIQRLRDQAANMAGSAVLTLARKRELLCQFAEDAEQKTTDRIKSIETDAKLAGEFKEDQNAGKVTDGLLTLMQSIAARRAS